MGAIARAGGGAILAAVLALGVLAVPARATVIAPITDAELARGADLSYLGTVTDIRTVRDPAADRIDTYITVSGLALGGPRLSGDIVIVQPGGRVGMRADWVRGSPEFVVGETVLVFLAERADGRLSISQLAAGKFTVFLDASRGGWWVEGGVVPRRRRLEGVLRTIRRHLPVRTRSVRPQWRTLPRAAAAAPRSGAFSRYAITIITGESGVRWHEADDGVPIPFSVDSTGQAGLAPAQSLAAAQSALASWTGVDSASIVLAEGPAAGPAPVFANDGVNNISFNDAFGEIDNDTNPCSGVIAMTRVSGIFDLRTVNGTTFLRMTEANMTFNNGIETCGFFNATNFTEIVTHELGHGIGLGHSSDTGATMYFSAHMDGRGASLTADDQAGATFIYPAGGPTCGNGVVDAGEECDDANTVSGDGCDGCHVENCFACQGQPSVCTCDVGAACGVACGVSLVCQEPAPGECVCAAP